MACRELGRRRVDSTISQATVYAVKTGQGETSSSYGLRTVVNGVLHLFEELIDGDQEVLSPNTGHRRKVTARSLGTTKSVTAAVVDSDRRRHMLVFTQMAIQNGKLKSLQSQQTLADRSIGVRVELAALQVAKELVQCIVATLSAVVMASILSMVQGRAYFAVGMRVCGMKMSVWLVVLRCSMCISAIDGIERALKVVSSGSKT